MSNIAGEKCPSCGSEAHGYAPCSNPVVASLNAIISEQAARIVTLLNEREWQPIETAPGCAVLISRPTDKLMYRPTSAFRDATGVWRVFRSDGGNTPLPFEPTHWMPLPYPPASESEPAGRREA
jgi:hypothetical protein